MKILSETGKRRLSPIQTIQTSILWTSCRPHEVFLLSIFHVHSLVRCLCSIGRIDSKAATAELPKVLKLPQERISISLYQPGTHIPRPSLPPKDIFPLPLLYSSICSIHIICLCFELPLLLRFTLYLFPFSLFLLHSPPPFFHIFPPNDICCCLPPYPRGRESELFSGGQVTF